MQSFFRQRSIAAPALLLSFTLINSTAAFAADGVIPKLASPVVTVVKQPLGLVGKILQTGGTAASTVLNKPGSKYASNAESESAATTASLDTNSRGHKSVGRDFPVLQGEVSTYQPNTVVSQTINSLVDAALANDPRTAKLNKDVAHYNTLASKMFTRGKDTLNFTVPYRGLDPSIEAGNLATGENMKIKGLGAAEYAKQKQIDETHVKVVTSVMQIATGLGMADRAHGQRTVSTELNTLRGLVGDAEAERAVSTLQQWSTGVSKPAAAFDQKAWDVNQQRDKKLSVIATALNSDPVVTEVLTRLHKYNHRSKFARVSHRVIVTTLGTIALGPDFVGAGGRLALGAYVAATGGPEQDKIMKEMYLDNRLESRTTVLNAETQLALENYQLGKLTRNAVLMAASEAVVQQMAGPEILSEVLNGGDKQASSVSYPGSL